MIVPMTKMLALSAKKVRGKIAGLFFGGWGGGEGLGEGAVFSNEPFSGGLF